MNAVHISGANGCKEDIRGRKKRHGCDSLQDANIVFQF